MKHNNQEAFFTLLKAGLWPELEKQVSVDGVVDWEEIYRLASEQSVLGLVWAGIDSLSINQGGQGTGTCPEAKNQ